MTKPIADTLFVIPSSLDIRHLSFFMAQGDRFATSHPAVACNENDRVTGSDAPARILPYPV